LLTSQPSEDIYDCKPRIKEAKIRSIPMIFTIIHISVEVFDEIHHRVVGGKIVQRTDVGFVKMFMQVSMEVSLHIPNCKKD